MKFYDMISKYGFDIFEELPADIMDKFDNIGKYELTGEHDDNAISILDSTWDKTKDICKKYIDARWIDNLGIDKEELLEDIKLHCIFTMYLSIENEDLEGKTIIQCVDDYYEAGDMIDDPDKLQKCFKQKWDKWISIIGNGKYGNGFSYSDLYYYLLESIEIRDYEECLVYIPSEIFYEIITNWKECPYSDNNSGGINSKQLLKHHKYFNNLIEKSKSELDKTIKAFIIERLFNTSFLYQLVKHVNEEYDENVEKYNESVEKYKADIKKEYDEKYADLLLNAYESVIEENYDKFKISVANKLLVLSEIVSIPMVFCRSKYINMINTEYETNIKNQHWHLELGCNLYYLNSYLIPLLLRLYYILLFYRFNNEKNAHSCINNLLVEFIKANFSKYDHKKFEILDVKKLQKGLGTEPLLINATEIIYNYSHYREDFYKDKYDETDTDKNNGNDESIFDKMKEMEGKIITEIPKLNCKYNYNSYQHKFPSNKIYLNYKNR